MNHSHFFLSKSQYNSSADLLITFNWLLNKQFQVLEISLLGDAFLQSEKGEIYWLATDSGELQKITSSTQVFYSSLKQIEHQEEWLMASFLQEIEQANIIRDANQIYSYKIPPVLGGDYTIENIQASDVEVHFYLLGQIFQQIHNLPDGHPVRISSKK